MCHHRRQGGTPQTAFLGITPPERPFVGTTKHVQIAVFVAVRRIGVVLVQGTLESLRGALKGPIVTEERVKQANTLCVHPPTSRILSQDYSYASIPRYAVGLYCWDIEDAYLTPLTDQHVRPLRTVAWP